jgi:hypothetical protein
LFFVHFPSSVLIMHHDKRTESCDLTGEKKPCNLSIASGNFCLFLLYDVPAFKFICYFNLYSLRASVNRADFVSPSSKVIKALRRAMATDPLPDA